MNSEFKYEIEKHPCETHQLSYDLLWISGLVFLFFLIVSCDQTFEPLQKNDKYHFSIYGYLDAAADTQWVRVGTIRQSVDEPPDPNGIQVTLEDLQSSETVVMNDSVFTSKNVLNYWTTMDIEYEQTYRITAKGADGKASRVTVTTPNGLPPLYIITQPTPPKAALYFPDVVKHIADIQSVWYTILKSGTEIRRRIYRFPIRNTLRNTYSSLGTFVAVADWDEQREQIESSIGGADISVVTRQFFVAVGGPEWDDSLSSIDDLEYFLDGTASNVENGLGYVVGISSGWYPQVTCLTPDRSNYAPCEPREPFW
ncbi:hypothetical protein [Rhodohalobacter sp. 8-1]|uniref:hypothetical protein n=1 Tax=Rhodohalobacter sp. 8-1 TaxID=3131972 RepID=UPI0030EDEDC7